MKYYRFNIIILYYYRTIVILYIYIYVNARNIVKHPVLPRVTNADYRPIETDIESYSDVVNAQMKVEASVNDNASLKKQVSHSQAVIDNLVANLDRSMKEIETLK